MPPPSHAAEATVLERLRAAGEPVRESVLYERVRSRHPDLEPEPFIAVLERLAALGRLHVAVDHDRAGRDPAPFQPRFWRVIR